MPSQGVDRLRACTTDRLLPFVMDVTKDEDVRAATQRITASGLELWAVMYEQHQQQQLH